jgi:TetR/AcrR family transcriptional regulator
MTVRSTSVPRRGKPSAKRGRRSRQHAGQTRVRIENAAVQEFAEVGFDATSTREIAARAGVNQQLITYHFDTKLALWKAVADRIFGELENALATRQRGLEGVDDLTRARLLLKEYFRFSAAHPEVNRFMVHEGARRGPRLAWLVQRHLRPLFAGLRRRIADAQAHGLAPPGDPIHIAYILVGATLLFSQAAEFELLTGRDARSPEVVEAHADLVLRLMGTGSTWKKPGGDRHE